MKYGKEIDESIEKKTPRIIIPVLNVINLNDNEKIIEIITDVSKNVFLDFSLK